MELKEYQKQVVQRLSSYLTALSKYRETYDKAMETTPELARDYHFPEKAPAIIATRVEAKKGEPPLNLPTEE